MFTNQFLRTLITAVCLLVFICGAAAAQDPGNFSSPENVTIVGEGGFPVENEKIMNGSGMDAFGPVYSASNDFQITLKDVYITDGLTVITLSLGTSHSASNHVSSASVYINGEQRGGGGSSVSFDAEGNPEVDEDSQFIQTDHFLYQDADITPDSLAVWAQSITIELNCAGTLRTSAKVLNNEESFPMKLVQFVQ